MIIRRNEEIYRKREQEFYHLTEHCDESWKYDEQPGIFVELEGVGNVVKPYCLEYLIYVPSQNQN